MAEEEIVYHYCSVESFFNIIKSKKFWLSDARYMNDTHEIKWMDRMVYKILDELSREKKEQLESIKEFRDKYQEYQHKKHYIMSFSKEKDLLSQWKGYADDAKGVSIGFKIDTDIIKPYDGSSWKDGTHSSKLALHKAFYEYKNLKLNIEQFIDENHINDPVLFLKDIAIVYKNPIFCEEQEQRLIYTPDNDIVTSENIE